MQFSQSFHLPAPFSYIKRCTPLNAKVVVLVALYYRRRLLLPKVCKRPDCILTVLSVPHALMFSLLWGKNGIKSMHFGVRSNSGFMFIYLLAVSP